MSGDGISWKDYVDAQDEKTRAQNEAAFSRIETKLDQMPKLWPLVLSGFVGLVSAIGLVFAILAYASDRFDGGLAVSGIRDEILATQREIDVGQNARIDRILSALEAQRDKPQSGPQEGQN